MGWKEACESKKREFFRSLYLSRCAGRGSLGEGRQSRGQRCHDRSEVGQLARGHVIPSRSTGAGAGLE